jgi:hypothetical protein
MVCAHARLRAPSAIDLAANDDQRPFFDLARGDRGTGGLLMRTSRGTNTGQAATETMISMLFLMLMIWGLVHLSMFAVSKYVANYAAWSAARAAMVYGAPSGLGSIGQPAAAAMHVMGNWRWATLLRTFSSSHNFRGRNRTVIEVDMRVPFGAPIFPSTPLGGIRVYGRAAMIGNTYDVMQDWGDQQ